MISYDDFTKLDLRIATVLVAERVPETDKLLRLEIDCGEGDSRQIVSGIAEHFSPEEMVGRQIVIVANLEPRVIRGVESRGMILAVRDEDVLSLLQPDKEVGPGSKVN